MYIQKQINLALPNGLRGRQRTVTKIIKKTASFRKMAIACNLLLNLGLKTDGVQQANSSPCIYTSEVHNRGFNIITK